MNKYQAQHFYWNRFGLPAFNELTVPDMVPDGKGGMMPLVEPYITYESVDGRTDGVIPVNARVNYRGRSWEPITDKIIEMEKIANTCIFFEGGCLKVRVPFTNFSRDGETPQDDQLRSKIITVEMEFITY